MVSPVDIAVPMSNGHSASHLVANAVENASINTEGEGGLLDPKVGAMDLSGGFDTSEAEEEITRDNSVENTTYSVTDREGSTAESLPTPNDRALDTDGDSEVDDASLAGSIASPPANRLLGSKRGMKRKPPIAEDEYIQSNPALYGLRRSGRARLSRRAIRNTSDSESDAVAPPPKRRRATQSLNSASLRVIDSETDSTSDLYEGPRRWRAKGKHRTVRSSSNAPTPVRTEIRFSTRRANKVCNYNEDSDDQLFEDEAENAPIEWVSAIDDLTPAIDKILYHRFTEGVDLEKPNLGRNDCEFYIKWQDQSHYHATWETAESLAGCKGERRLENYVRKEVAREIFFMRDPDVIPEESEKWNLDRERYLEKIEDFKKVERIIGSRETDGSVEYFVKWKRLQYDCCTWEDAALASQIAQREIDRYLNRRSHPPISNRAESNVSTRSKFEPIHGKPDFIENGQLKEFQVKGVNFLAYNWVRGRNVVLADEMGLGKTVQTVAFINWLRLIRGQQGPFIVIVPLSTMPSWSETFDHWTPDINYVVYNGPESARRTIKDYELLIDGNIKRPRFHVLLTTYEYALQDAHFLSQIKWQFMAVDEAHRLKNRDSQLYSKLVEFKSACRLLITGTPVQNNLGELSALLDFLNPGVIEIDENMDLNSEAASRKLAELTQSIQPFMLRRTKNKVESELPPKSEKIIRVELSDVQLELYKNILTKNYDALNHGGKGPKPSLLNIMTELKKASNHPFMFWNTENQVLKGSSRREDILKALVTSSGKMMVLDQLLTKLKNDGHRVLIFSQMVRMLNILADYMDARGFSYQRLDGTISAGPRRLAIEHYNAPDSSDFAFLLSTRAGGLGINLMTADTVVLFDSDWNPQADLQAMARAHRIGQTRPVSVYRLVAKDTVEEEVLERARNKLLLEFITIQRGVTDNEATELKHKMVRAGHHLGEPTSFNDISRILKQRGQRMFEQSGNQKKLEELDIDTVLANAEEHTTVEQEAMEVNGGMDFINECQYVDVKFEDLSWDDIIPKEYFEKVKSEEQQEMGPKQHSNDVDQGQMVNASDAFDEREERKAKRRARQQVSLDSGSLSDEVLAPDPNRPLNEKEYRHLIRAYLRYGDIDERETDLIKEARLVGRDINVVKNALQEVIGKARLLEQDESDKIRALEREGKSFTKKERKAVLFDHRGVKRLNAETIVGRADEMRILRAVTLGFNDPKNFRIPEATKSADYSCPWGAREDGMLCVGIARHGYGAWAQIRDDPELDLMDKLFLEEHRIDRKNQRISGKGEGSKSPGAVHLVRRADYLLSVLKVKASNGASAEAKKALENHHRNNKKAGMSVHQQNSASVSASPSPSISRKAREASKVKRRLQNYSSRNSAEGSNTPVADSRRLRADSERHWTGLREENSPPLRTDDRSGVPLNGSENMLKIIFKPIREHLRRVSQVTKENIPSKTERAAELRRLLRMMGDFIRNTVEGEEARASLEQRLWDHCAAYWPNKDTPGNALLNMYGRLIAAEKTT